MWLPLLLPVTLAGAPRAELPRPDLARASWTTLNGSWEFCFDPEGTGESRGLPRPGAEGFDRRIVVPFPWESRLSGVGVTDYHGAAWYRRSFDAPRRQPHERVHLCFGAVDWSCQVWVNGQRVGQHTGGYTPFRLDVTDALQAGANDLVVQAVDPTDPHLPTGKQVRWYTTTSGLWQPVWLEVVPPVHVTHLATATTLAPPQARLLVTIQAPTATRATVRATPARKSALQAAEVAVDLRPGANLVELVVPVPGGRPWSPEDPFLYDYRLTVQAGDATDTVSSYFGLRTLAAGPAPGAPHSAILLNGQPVYLRGALHQVFNPEGLYTFPTDQAIRRDLELAKDLGWNFLRLHIKLVDPRFLYWADRLGVLLMADLPNTWEHSERARQAFEAQLREAIPRDRMHPSIFAWCVFNESWGIGFQKLKQDTAIQTWVEAMWRLAKELDPTRLVEDNSPCFNDHVDTDLNSWHFYIDDYAAAERHVQEVSAQTFLGSGWNFCPGRVQRDQPLLNSEYGAVSAGGGDRDVAWGFKYLTTLLRAMPKCQGYVYTEHCDIEWEHNGLVCYDRTPKGFGYDAFVPAMQPRDLQGADFVGYHGPPVIQAAPGATVEVRPFVSHFSQRQDAVRLRWRIRGWDQLGQPLRDVVGEAPATWTAAGVVDQPPLALPLPADLASGAIGLELLAGPERLAANYVNVLTTADRPLPPAEAIEARTVALRLPPEAIAACDAPAAPQLLAELGRDKLSAPGQPSFTWRFCLPEALRPATFENLTVLVEAGARGGDAKLDWPARRKPTDYPQTKLGRATPSALRARLGGVELGTVALADDWADATGVLSHLARWQHGSYGMRVALNLDLRRQSDLAAQLQRGEPVDLVLDVPTENGQGLSIYGATMGRYTFPPTILLRSRRDLPVPAGWTSDQRVTLDEMARPEAVLPTAEAGGATWRYTTERPAAGWEQPEFDAGGWREGRSGFGTAGTPNAIVGTRWDTPDIWLRASLKLPAALGPQDAALLRLYHDEDAEVYLNGTKLLSRTGYVTQYQEVTLTPEQVRLLRAGDNVLAVHCRQTTGGQNIDVGLSVIRAR